MPLRFYRFVHVFGLLLCFFYDIRLAQADDGHAPKIVAEFRFSSAQEVILIDTTWEGKPAELLFDTGCTISILDSAFFPSIVPIHDQIDIKGSNGSQTEEMYNPPDLSIGPLHLIDAGPVACLDLSAIRSQYNLPIIGVLGYNVWRKFIAQIDFDNRELRLFEPDDRPHPEWGGAIPLETPQDADGPEHNTGAFVRMSIGGFEELFLVDTGDNNGGSIPHDGFDNIVSATNCPVGGTPVFTITGKSLIRMMRTPEFVLGGNHYRDLLFGENKTWHGVLGLDFLSRHLVTIDLPHAKLYLKPGKAFARHDVFYMSGVVIQGSKEHLVVTIIPKSQADLAGLRNGDTLLKVNGKDANSYELSDLRKLLQSKEGTEIDILFLRDGTMHSATFKLRDCL